MKTILKHNETILFIGDSITDCGRRDPQTKPLGCGYVNFFNDMLLTRDSDKTITVLNRGIGGNTVEDLRSRWHDDVLAFRSDWLSIKIGINDLNRFLCKQGPILLPPETYEEIYNQVLTLTRAELPNCKFLLIDPFYGSTDAVPESYRAKVVDILPRYLEVVERLAVKHQTRHIKMHSLFHQKLKNPRVCFPDDPVHPLSTGHFFIAESVYNELSQP